LNGYDVGEGGEGGGRLMLLEMGDVGVEKEMEEL
jgi:hypothetical protein